MPAAENHSVADDTSRAVSPRNPGRPSVRSKSKDKKSAPRRYRSFKITQYLHHPETGEALMTPRQLQRGLAHRSITKWAWTEHDKDRRSDGSRVPPHIHIALQCRDARTREQIAEWFGVPLELVQVLGGRGGFASYLRYLTHEDPTQQALGKHRYPDTNVVANFDWRGEIEAHFARPLKLPTRLDEVKVGVLSGNLSIWEVRETDPLMYAKHFSTLKRLAEECRMANVEAGTLTPNHQDMKLRVRTGVTLTETLSWIADRLGFEGDNYDRMLRASNVVTGKDRTVNAA
jgi:hypothetical protein